MAYVDFSTYTEVDTNTKITIATDTITFDTGVAGADDRVYKDYTAAHFNAIDHDFRFQAAGGGSTRRSIPWAISNVIDDATDWDTNNDEAVAFMTRGSGILYFYSYENETVDSGTFTASTNYDVLVERAANNATITAKIYEATTPAHQHLNLLDTLTETVPEARTWRYHFGLNYPQLTGDAGVSQYHDLNEAAAGNPWYYYAQQAG